MSLINQMLKDLEARRGDAGGAAFAVSPGLVLDANGTDHAHHGPVIAAWTAGIVLLASAGFAGIRWWESRPVLEGNFETVIATQTGSLRAGTADTPRTAPLETPESTARVVEVQASDAVVVEPAMRAVRRVQETPPRPQPAVAEPKPIKTTTPKQQADRLFSRAEQALAAQQRQKGEILLREALFAYPQHLSARTRLAALMVENDNPGAAERLLLQGLSESGRSLELTIAYAQLLAARGSLDEALYALDGAASPGADDAQWHALRAAILYRLARHGEAAASYRRALQSRPAEALWWTGLAVAQEHDGRPREALQAYQRAARLPLDNAVLDYVTQRIQALQTTDGL